MFTCLPSRVVHIEITNSLETDLFILALRASLQDVAMSELWEQTMAQTLWVLIMIWKKRLVRWIIRIHNFLANTGADWLIWSRNSLATSHMGEVWERQIRSARSFLASLLKNHCTCLKDEPFPTLTKDVEAIVNSRPLTVETISDPLSLTPLSLSNLLTMKNRVIMPPLGSFVRPDLYNRRQWRRIQHLADEF